MHSEIFFFSEEAKLLYQQGINNESSGSQFGEMLRFLLCSRRKDEGNTKTLTCNSMNFAMKLRFLLMSICVGEWSSTSLSFCSWPGREQHGSEINHITDRKLERGEST